MAGLLLGAALGAGAGAPELSARPASGVLAAEATRVQPVSALALLRPSSTCASRQHKVRVAPRAACR
jgi:hypothetical protein